MLNIYVEDPVNESKHYVRQNSWGLDERDWCEGKWCMVTTKGWCFLRGANFNIACEELVQTLKKAGIWAKAELRDGSTAGYKFNDWEGKGALLGLEYGLDGIATKQTLAMRRDAGA
ncbi:hypothetical protein BKA70DRAFT_1437151 [Coprinopsis sp. MPI-PUGE-AT-0042]|nr:hypothetical protein BKA70DRAFT_1437151 [Coprinopsis sp. MPI-PUGE-AT-0042]